ncbi:hypothetical protein [Bacteroides ihuae]|uniref:hypothetical protein n=1 Tax=Bacteroides ihuae TaxID=1852362 RepID=UPI0008D91B39|nr:hypothetical protein [Bacteroides ihuae]
MKKAIYKGVEYNVEPSEPFVDAAGNWIEDGYKSGIHRFLPEDLEFIRNEITDSDWEQRRYELAKAAMQSISQLDEFKYRFATKSESVSYDWLCRESIKIADTMVKKLKGE